MPLTPSLSSDEMTVSTWNTPRKLAEAGTREVPGSNLVRDFVVSEEFIEFGSVVQGNPLAGQRPLMSSVALLPNVTSLSGLLSWCGVGYLVNAVSLQYATRGSGGPVVRRGAACPTLRLGCWRVGYVTVT
jgi:hypothetical protein